jgi:DNA-binding MarR family transcriptional regulator
MNDPGVEPAAYWTGLAHQALTAFTRAREAELGLTHPQFCLLCALSEQDGRTIYELRRALERQLLTGEDLAAEAEALLELRHIRVDRHGRLWITQAGREACEEQSQHLPEITARIHDGIPDAEFAAALTVLRRMVHNVSGG